MRGNAKFYAVLILFVLGVAAAMYWTAEPAWKPIDAPLRVVPATPIGPEDGPAVDPERVIDETDALRQNERAMQIHLQEQRERAARSR